MQHTIISYRDIGLVDIPFISRLPETVCIISDRNGLRNAGNTFHTDIIAVLRQCRRQTFWGCGGINSLSSSGQQRVLVLMVWTLGFTATENCNVPPNDRTYSRTPLIGINWDGEPFGYAKNPDNWIFLWKQATLAVWSSAVATDSMYLRLNLSTTPDLKF
jgi:hypothetical protein